MRVSKRKTMKSDDINHALSVSNFKVRLELLNFYIIYYNTMLCYIMLCYNTTLYLYSYNLENNWL